MSKEYPMEGHVSVAAVAWVVGVIAFVLIAAIAILPSIRNVGPTDVGLVRKRFGKKLPDENPVALNGEAGYQIDLLMPGFRFKPWWLYSVKYHPWVQVPAGQISVVIAQCGRGLPSGAKSAVYKREFGDFTDLRAFIKNDGQKGLQRHVLPPNTMVPIHPIGFLVITMDDVYGEPVDPNLAEKKQLTCQDFGLKPEQLKLVIIEPSKDDVGNVMDMIGIVTILEGDPLPSGDIASRLGAFEDIAAMEKDGKADPEIIEVILGSKNSVHNNYQNIQAFLDSGGKIGLQHDPLLYGAYVLNPFLVRVERVPMLVVKQGETAIIKAFVGLTPQDTSGSEFKFGALVRPGHRGIWNEPLRTGKYAVNPHIYQAEIVPTAILTLNWAKATSAAHDLDQKLSQIDAKSCEGFEFKIDLQVQIHVPDTKASKVISMVGTMRNLVEEVLQAAVGNHFRDKLQSMHAVMFIETRQQVQEEAYKHILEELKKYDVETRGVYIQDVILPKDLVDVLQQREIANQQILTFQREKAAEDERILMEKSKGLANKQSDLSASEVEIDIKDNERQARIHQADGDAAYIRETGKAKGAEIEAVGMARAKAYQAQVAALGPQGTALVNSVVALSDSKMRWVPDVLVTGGNGMIDGLGSMLMQRLNGGGNGNPVAPTVPKEPVAEPSVPSLPTGEDAKAEEVAPTP